VVAVELSTREVLTISGVGQGLPSRKESFLTPSTTHSQKSVKCFESLGNIGHVPVGVGKFGLSYSLKARHKTCPGRTLL
jgi:hypothetical protein